MKFSQHRAEQYRRANKEHKLVMNLRDLGHVIWRQSEGRGSQKRILILLSERPTITQKELTDIIGVASASASEVFGKLESYGLIERTKNAEDHRAIDIRLTDKGREKAQEAWVEREKRDQDMFSCLSEEEKDQLLGLLEKVNESWQQRYSKKE